MKTKTMKAILGLGLIPSILLVNEVTFAQETPETGHIVATEQINVGDGYSNAAVILRGWQLQKNNSNGIEIMDLGLAITDVEYQSVSGIVKWNVRMVNFSDGDAKDDIRFSYDYSVILLTDGIAIDFPLPSNAVDKNGLVISPEQISLNILGYQVGAIFPTGFMLHINPSPPTQGGFRDKDDEIQNFRFELADFNYNSSTGLTSWNVITDFRDQNGSPEGYKWKYGYTIILTNSSQKFSRASGFQTSTGSGSTGGTFNAASIPQAVVAPIGWELGYPSGDHNINIIGTSISNVSVSGASVSWTYNAALRDRDPVPFRWNVVAGGLIFSGTRIDGHFDSPGIYRFAAMRGEGGGGDTYENGPTAPGTYVPFTANLGNHTVTVGPLSSDRPYREISEQYSALPPQQGTPNSIRIKSAYIIDNAEGDLGKPYAKWHIWAFPAEGFDLALFYNYLRSNDQYNGELFNSAPHAINRRAVSTLLNGPFLSDTNKPEWGEEESIGSQYLEYPDFPVWSWDWGFGDRLIMFLWESDESPFPDDDIALFLIERGGTPGESFTTADASGSPGLLAGFVQQHLGSITFLNARSPGDVFVDGDYNGVMNGSWGLPFNTVSLGVAFANPGNIVSVESGSYNETLTIDKPLTIRVHGGTVIIGQ